MEDESVIPVATQLLECFCAALATTPDPPEICCFRVGERVSALLAVNDDECCHGLAWVRVVTEFPSEINFPEQDTTPNGNCPPGWLAVILEMGVMRCAPTGSVFENPSCPEWTELFQNTQHDSAAMRAAYCCLDVDGMAKVLGVWEPIALEGGCVGGTRTVTVQVPSCMECVQ